jgi:hypothetical protein
VVIVLLFLLFLIVVIRIANNNNNNSYCYKSLFSISEDLNYCSEQGERI